MILNPKLFLTMDDITYSFQGYFTKKQVEDLLLMEMKAAKYDILMAEPGGDLITQLIEKSHEIERVVDAIKEKKYA